MLFNSSEFLFCFLPIVTIVYFLLNKYRLLDGAKIWLIAASLFFYANPKIITSQFNSYIILLCSSVGFNYALGSAISNTKYKTKITKRTLLIFGITTNLLSIGYFKYYNFFIDNLNAIFNTEISTLNIILPLGISFFTFQQIAYLIDSYHGKTKDYDFLNYALFVVFFPQLIAGPIVRHQEIIPQFHKLRTKFFNWKNFTEGLYLFCVGLFKKIVIADSLSKLVNAGYSNPQILTCVEGWLVALSYTFQIYYDFSGYSDMAVGLGKMFNIKLPDNFNNPYSSTSIQEFWRKWHITLSCFLRDYLYFPLGGSRNKTQWRTYLNIMIVFSICGLWHGASWMFIIWGIIHGLALCINRLWKNTKIILPNFLSWIITFGFINIAWVFFRAPNMSSATDILKAMFGLNGFYIPKINKFLIYFDVNDGFFHDWSLLSAILLIILTFIIFIGKIRPDAKTLKPNILYALSCAVILTVTLVILCDSSYTSPFLYFNF